MRHRILLLPAALFFLHASAFGGWVVDDAGISLAYARNLAIGHGLVSQPGMPPVEGYSNPLWVFLLSCGFSLRDISPVLLVKFLSAALITLTFVVYLHVLNDRLPNGRFITILGLCLVSVETSVVVWSVSGLENSLTLLLTGILVGGLLSARPKSARVAGLMGCAVTALALTRPEGILYAWLYPVAVLRSFNRESTRALAIYVCVILVTALPYVVLRIFYFGELLPNSYYAKGGPGLDTVLALVLLQSPMLHRAIDLMGDLVGQGRAPWVLLATVAATSCALYRKTWTWTHSTLALMTLTSLAAYLMLPSDWMPAHRYATPFFLSGTLFGVSLLFGAAFSMPNKASPSWKEGAFGAALILGLALINVPRTLSFRRAPTISIEEVASRAQRLETVARFLRIKTPSWLTPDVGGALLYSHMRIYDLGMLCDSRISHYLGEGIPARNVAAFRDYVFNELQPTFISMRAYHSWISRMQEDPRLRRDYLPLHEFPDDWIRARFGTMVVSGEYVRRSAVEAGGRSLEAVQLEWAKQRSAWDR